MEHLGLASAPQDVVGSRYAWISEFGKPVIIAELGVAGGSNYVRSWLREMHQEAGTLPLLSAIVYFNDKEPYTWGNKYGSPDWRVTPEMLQTLMQDVVGEKLN